MRFSVSDLLALLCFACLLTYGTVLAQHSTRAVIVRYIQVLTRDHSGAMDEWMDRLDEGVTH